MIDSICAIAQNRFTCSNATQGLQTCTALSGWNEARAEVAERVRRRQLEQQKESNSECSWWFSAVRYITQAVAPITNAIEHLSCIGGAYPPNAQTALVALNAIAAVGACIGRMFSGPALGLSVLLRLANIGVLAGKCLNPSFAAVTKFSVLELTIYVVAIPLLLIPGAIGIIASGVIASLPELGAWIAKCKHNNDPHGISLFRQFARDPNDQRVAREVFQVSEGEDPNQTAVDQVYDWKYESSVRRMNKARGREHSFIVEMEKVEMAFLNQAYITLIGHPRTTGVD